MKAKLHKSLGYRVALMAGTILPFLIVSTLVGQTAAPSPVAAVPEAGPPPPVTNVAASDTGTAATVERIVITGSLIPTAEEVTASPVDTLNSSDIQIAGAASDVLTVLQKRNPDFVGAGNLGSTNANNASGATQGGSIIAIRGLPTLTLFEGRRITDSAAISSAGFQFTDASLFPTSLISRIDVLKDGASALYGSEAVGGVVNIFLKKDFTGAEIGARYGFTVESGVAERRAYAIVGAGNDTTHVTGGFQYYEIDPLFARERGYSQPAINLTTTYAGVGRDNAGGGTSYYLLKPGLNSPFDAGVVPGSIPPPPADSGTTNPGQYALIPQAYNPSDLGTVLGFDLSKLPTSTLDIQNTSAYGDFNHQIFGKQLELFGNFLYAHNHNLSFLNSQPLSNGTGVLILGSMKVDPETGNLVPEDRGPPAAFNPFQETIDDTSQSGTFRLIAANRYQNYPRKFDDNTNFYRFLLGLRSQFAKDWTFETTTYYSKYEIQFTNSNLVNAQQLNAMIAGTAVDFNGNPIPALDFFARNPIGDGPGQVTAAQFGTIFGSNIRAQSSYQEVFDARATGFPFHLPGGDVGLSFGGEFRQEGFKLTDSPEIFVGSVPVQNIDQGRGITSAYAELNIPIVGPQMKIPGIYSLELDGAFRYDHYEGVKEDAKVPKVTLRYQPIQDITMRATYSNSFVAPTLFQLFGPAVTGFSGTISLNGQVQDQAQVLAGSNPNLVPSTAESYTGGIVYSPHQIPGLTVTFDYFRTLQLQTVGTIDISGGATILTSVNDLGPASPYANLVAFNNFPGQPGARPVTAPNQLFGNLASVFYINSAQNIGANHVAGFDMSAHYNLDFRRYGQGEIGVNAVWFTLSELKRVPNAHYYNISGLDFPEGGGGNPDYKLTFLTRYSYQGASLSLNANYIPGLINAIGHDAETENQGNFQKIGDYFAVDGRLEYQFHVKPAPSAPPAGYSKDGKDSANVVAGAGGNAEPEKVSPFNHLLDGLTVAVGCNNIFDRQPPFVAGANSNTDLSIYDPFGRFVYFEVSKKF